MKMFVFGIFSTLVASFALLLLNSFCQAEFPASSCGAAPKISGGYMCGYSSYDGSYTYDYTCQNDCSKKVGSLVCPAGSKRWAGKVPECKSADGKSSPCPINIPVKAPYSKIFGTSKCDSYPGSSSLLCKPNVPGAKVLSTSISQVRQAHNCWRRNVNPKAVKMPDLQWDPELAVLAERWATQCLMMHTPGDDNFVVKGGESNGVGQNYAMQPGNSDWASVVDGWASERAKWTYGPKFNLGEVGHYTQVIWANSLYVGCARAQCPNTELIYYFCNYYPPGNYLDQQPYIAVKGNAAGRRTRRKRIYA